MNCGGVNYINKVIKLSQGMVWRASEIKCLNQPLLINKNLTRDEADECYPEAVVELEKLKKKFKIASTGNFVYA